MRAALIGTVGLILVAIAACQSSQGGFSGSVGNTPSGPPQTTYEFLGTPGTPFAATLSDSRSSWAFNGNIPLSVIIINNSPPTRIVATKNSAGTELLSVQVFNGGKIVTIASTSAPFGNVSLQNGGVLNALAPPASPDLRISVTGPFAETYTALVEDINIGFVVTERAPTLYVFDTPNGKVDATFFGNQDFGTFTANMTLDGLVVASVTKGPNATIREP